MDIQIRISLIDIDSAQRASDLIDKVCEAAEEAAGDNFDYAMSGPEPTFADREWEDAADILMAEIAKGLKGNA